VTERDGPASVTSMANNFDHARHRGLRAALAAAGGKIRDAIPTITITSAALLAAITSAGCPKWGPPAPPPFRQENP